MNIGQQVGLVVGGFAYLFGVFGALQEDWSFAAGVVWPIIILRRAIFAALTGKTTDGDGPANPARRTPDEASVENPDPPLSPPTGNPKP